MALRLVGAPLEPGQKVRYGAEQFTVIEVYKEEVKLKDEETYSGWKVLAWKPGKTVRTYIEEFTGWRREER